MGANGVIGDKPAGSVPRGQGRAMTGEVVTHRAGRHEHGGNEMKKLIAGAVLALAVMGLGGTASAGEVTGSGKGGPAGDGRTPIAEHRASSECAFSGLEDGEEDQEGPSGPGTTQSWGQIPTPVRDEISQFGAHPGDACRGNATHA